MTKDEEQRLNECGTVVPRPSRTLSLSTATDWCPASYREAVMDLMPGGVVIGDDLTGPFRLSGLVAEYVAMKATQAQ